MVPWLRVEKQVTIFSSLQAADASRRADQPAILVHAASLAERPLDENYFS
jgi:hypothetical protein